MRANVRRPVEAMGEAWFMGESRLMYDLLFGNLEELPLDKLREPLETIASGNSSFGPMDEWTHWYHYLLAQLVARHAEHSSFDSLYQHLITAFIAVHPRGIDEPYPGFADDAVQTLGRSLMDPSRWITDRLAVSTADDRSADERCRAFDWSVTCGDFSAGMFFCAKYLEEDDLDAWLDSVFTIQCPLWTTQLYCWLLAAHPLLAGRVLELARLDPDPWSNVVWDGAHVLRGNFTGIYLLPPDRCEAVMAAARRHVSEISFFAWLDGIKAHAELEAMLYGMPSRFAEVFDVG